MACEGCQQRRAWLAQRFRNLTGNGVVRTNTLIRGEAISLQTTGNITTVSLKDGTEIGTVEADTEEKRLRAVVDLVALHKAT